MPTVWIIKNISLPIYLQWRNIYGEEYIGNDCGECAHFGSVDYNRDLAEFLWYEIKEMADESYQWIKNILV